MKKGNPRDLALSVLNSDAGGQARGNEWSLSDRWDAFPWSDDRDRAFAMNLVQGVRRWRLRLDWIVEHYLDFPFSRLEPAVLNILRLALYQIFFMSKVPQSAAVDEAVGQVRRISRRPHLRGFVNGILRQICREKEVLELTPSQMDPIEFMSVYYSFPAWMVRRFLMYLGNEDTAMLLNSLNQVPRLVCRTNSLKIDRDGLAERLAKEGVSTQKTGFSPQGLVIEGLRGPPDTLKAFAQGLFQVQGEAAQICSYLLAPLPGEMILDVCAGLGGKSTHMAELMKGRGRILALDLSIERLRVLRSNAGRLGISSIEEVAADALAPQGLPFRCLFDRILIDAPCSGLGIIGRHPEIKWKRIESDLERLAEVQLNMLLGCAGLLRPGGRLLYSTCTVTREENDGVVKQFLAARPEMELVPLQTESPQWARALIDEEGFLRTYPHKHGIEGFFAALMIRKS